MSAALLLLEALRELVALDELRDTLDLGTIPKPEYVAYHVRREKAWDAARAAIASAESAGGQEPVAYRHRITGQFAIPAELIGVRAEFLAQQYEALYAHPPESAAALQPQVPAELVALIAEAKELSAGPSSDWTPGERIAANVLLRRLAHVQLPANSPEIPEGWRPIATAPRDGTTVLIFENYSECVGAAYYADEKGGWLWESDYRYGRTKPIMSVTCWQPLPAPPSDAEGAANPVLPAIASMLARLTDEQRLELFGAYCRVCGRADPKCQCWNDE